MQTFCGFQAILLCATLFSSHALAMPLPTEPKQSESQIAGRKDCQFVPPAGWHDRVIIWDGACQSGKAHGQGVLRAYQKHTTTLIFFGNLEHGELSLGVIDNGEGYIAGQFSQGRLLPDAERNVIIHAFRNASAAAKAYSQRLIQAGNKLSAAFYLKKAEELDQQMD